MGTKVEETLILRTKSTNFLFDLIFAILLNWSVRCIVHLQLFWAILVSLHFVPRPLYMSTQSISQSMHFICKIHTSITVHCHWPMCYTIHCLVMDAWWLARQWCLLHYCVESLLLSGYCAVKSQQCCSLHQEC